MEYSRSGGGLITHKALKEQGFDFNHFTSHLPLKSEKGIGRMVYDQSYVFFPEGLVRINQNSNLRY